MDKNKCPKMDFPKKSLNFEKYCILYNKLPKQLKENRPFEKEKIESNIYN
jgi:hypothetical protein